MKRTAQKAFTMIELLVVIAVIGVMATAVLSAINPLEQINKGNDTGLRSDAEQIIGAVDRYYSSLAYFPWQTGANDDTNLNVAWQNVIDLNTDTNILANLESTQEIKHGFTLRLTDTKRKPLMLLYNSTADSPTMFACFQPKSNSFAVEAYNRCKDTVSPPGTPFVAVADASACGGGIGASSACKGDDAGTTEACFVCLP